MLRVARVYSYPSGAELFAQGSEAEDVYLLEHGLLKLTRRFQDGREVILGLRYPGELLGAASVVLQKPYPVTAVAVGRCQLRRVPSHVFMLLLNNDPAFNWSVFHAHSREIYSQYDLVAELSCCSARNRLEHFFWRMSSSSHRMSKSKENSKIRLKIPLKHWEIAQLLAITPPYLSRLLGQLEGEGIIERRKGWLIVCNPDALWHLS